jgi:uncharacterized membrane protein
MPPSTAEPGAAVRPGGDLAATATDRLAATAAADLAPAVPSARALRWLYVIGGGVGFAAAFVLLVEKIAMIDDPSYVPSCSFNPVLACGSIMSTPQSELFGFPNPILGVAGFAVVVTIGAALVAGAEFRTWFWVGLAAGASAGAVLVHWLIFQSLYRIGALCPYCMVVWTVTIPIFLYTVLHVAELTSGRLPAPVAAAARVVGEFHGVALTVWFLAVTGLIGVRFWDYWSTLLP